MGRLALGPAQQQEILEGDVDFGAASSFALMNFGRDDGKALLCYATPRADVVIEADIDVDDDLPVHPVQDYVGTVLDSKRLFPRDIYREEFLDEGDKATGGIRSLLLRR